MTGISEKYVIAGNAESVCGGGRIEWLDFIRSLAILMVVTVHSTENIYSFTLDAMSEINLLSKIFAFSMFTFGRLGVPLFCMLTGYLLLSRKYETTSDVFSFWRKKLLPLLLAYICWTIVYEVFGIFVFKWDWNLPRLLYRLLMCQDSPMSHMWYMEMIIGIYLILPFLSVILNKFEFRIIAVIAAIYLITCFIMPDVNYYLVLHSQTVIQPRVFLNYSSGSYGLYIVCGYLFRLFQPKFEQLQEEKRWIKPAIVLFIVLCFSAMVNFQLWSYKTAVPYNVWYSHTPLLLCAVAVFACGCLMQNHLPSKKLKSKLSASATGIYFVHMLFIILLRTNSLILSLQSKPVQVCGLTLAVFCLSYLTVELLSCVPYISRVLFLLTPRKKIPLPVNVPKAKTHERIAYIDFIKAVGIFLVIFCHNPILSGTSVMGNILMALAWAACPLFFMCSGTVFILSKTWNWRKWETRLLKTYLSMAAWKFIYFLIYKWLYGVSCTAVQFVTYLFLFGSLENVITGHMWFMNAYLMLLFLLPMIWHLYHCGKNGKYALLVMAITAGFGGCFIRSFDFASSVISNGLGLPLISLGYFADAMPFGIHSNMIPYFIAGAFFHEYSDCLFHKIPGLNRRHSPNVFFALLAVLSLGMLLTVKYIQTGSFRWSNRYLEYGYDWLSTMLLSMSLFLVFQSIHLPEWIDKIISYIGAHTQASYYLHVPILALLVKYVYPYLTDYVSTFANSIKSIVVLGICLLLFEMMKRVPVLKEIV